MNHTSTSRPAFTLIELLVVISIIAILAGIGGPALVGAIRTGKMTQATANARQIAFSLRMFAGDSDGNFPSDPKFQTANDAFRGLFPAYLQDESIFAVGSSPVGKKADNTIEPENRVLERGENHWAYVQGLSTSSTSLWPLIVDHTDGSGRYTNKETSPGGTWLGAKAIVVRTDNSASAVPLQGTGQKRFLPRHDNRQKNALEVRDYMGEGAKLLEPAR